MQRTMGSMCVCILEFSVISLDRFVALRVLQDLLGPSLEESLFSLVLPVSKQLTRKNFELGVNKNKTYTSICHECESDGVMFTSR